MIGREEQVQTIKDYIMTNDRESLTVVLLHGLPVVGKSALARYVASIVAPHFPDNHFVIDMKGVNTQYITVSNPPNLPNSRVESSGSRLLVMEPHSSWRWQATFFLAQTLVPFSFRCSLPNSFVFFFNPILQSQFFIVFPHQTDCF